MNDMPARFDLGNDAVITSFFSEIALKIDGKKTKIVESYLGNSNLKNHFVSFVESLKVSGISFLNAEPRMCI